MLLTKFAISLGLVLSAAAVTVSGEARVAREPLTKHAAFLKRDAERPHWHSRRQEYVPILETRGRYYEKFVKYPTRDYTIELFGDAAPSPSVRKAAMDKAEEMKRKKWPKAVKVEIDFTPDAEGRARTRYRYIDKSDKRTPENPAKGVGPPKPRKWPFKLWSINKRN
ncbi:hypothetical protein C8J56DRAFT_1031499 [Mycena floridula]|nr:hypothetical protein C8J56DRAFT_1031499 [Mycena floridula]